MENKTSPSTLEHASRQISGVAEHAGRSLPSGVLLTTEHSDGDRLQKQSLVTVFPRPPRLDIGLPQWFFQERVGKNSIFHAFRSFRDAFSVQDSTGY
jgi:hypothetical protein